MIDLVIPVKLQQYCNTLGLRIEERLGVGQDGSVWRVGQSAVQLFDRDSNYERERNCYLRLAEHGVAEIDGVSIPQLIHYDDEMLIIRMGVVQPPYLLDFGKAYLDHEPDYSAEVMDEWEAAGTALFESDWPRVKDLLSTLRSYGIVYYDAKPGNINLRCK